MSPISIPGKVTLKQSLDADPYYGAVSLLLHGDGADGSTQIIDSSVNTKTVTVNGNAQISTTESKFNGSSLKFDGSGDYLDIPTSTDFDCGTGDWTIESFVYQSSIGPFYPVIISNQVGSFSAGAIALTAHNQTSSPNKFAFSVYDIDSGNPALSASTTHSTNVWYHIAVVRNGTTLTMYRNGASVASRTISSSVSFNFGNNGLCSGGGNWDGSNSYLDGYIDDLRVTKGVARYTSNFTPPTQPFFNNFKTGYDPHYFYDVSLLLKGDGTNGSTNIVDSSFDPKTITVNGDAQISTAQSKFGGSSLKFDGTGDYLSISDTSVFNVGTGDFTIEWWQKLAATNLNYTQFKFYSNGGIKAANGAIQLYTGPSNTNVAGTTTFTTDWEHIAVVRSSGVMSFFHKGIYVPPNLANTGSATSITPTLIEIGTPFATYVNMNGYIDDFRITKGIARYTSNFTPPGPSPTF